MSTAQDRAVTVLERKAIAQRRALGVGAVSAPRALGRSLSLAADALWSLGLVATVGPEATVTTARALSAVTDDQLLIVLEKDDGPCGLAALDRALVTGLTEIQTLGKVTRFPLEDRLYTATDAAMVAPLLDAALPRFSSMLVGQPEREYLQGYGFGALADDVQSATLALDAERFHVFRFEIGLAQDLRSGNALFLFPAAQEKPADQPGSEPKPGKYEASMKLVPTRMQAILTRIHIPLEKAQALKPGDLLEMSPDVVNAATLVVDGGHVAAKGKIGQINGFRAVRIGEVGSLLHAPALAAGKDGAQKPADAGPALPAIRSQAKGTDGLTLDAPIDLDLDAMSAGWDPPANSG